MIKGITIAEGAPGNSHLFSGFADCTWDSSTSVACWAYDFMVDGIKREEKVHYVLTMSNGTTGILLESTLYPIDGITGIYDQTIGIDGTIIFSDDANLIVMSKYVNQ